MKRMIKIVPIIAILSLLGGCAFPFGGEVVKPLADVAKTGLETAAAKKIADDAKEAIKDVSKNKTKRVALETEVKKAEIAKDSQTNLALEAGIMSLPVPQRVELIKQALEVRLEDVKADVKIAQAEGDKRRNDGVIMTLILILILVVGRWLGNKFFIRPTKTVKSYV